MPTAKEVAIIAAVVIGVLALYNRVAPKVPLLQKVVEG